MIESVTSPFFKLTGQTVQILQVNTEDPDASITSEDLRFLPIQNIFLFERIFQFYTFLEESTFIGTVPTEIRDIFDVDEANTTSNGVSVMPNADPFIAYILLR